MTIYGKLMCSSHMSVMVRGVVMSIVGKRERFYRQ